MKYYINRLKNKVCEKQLKEKTWESFWAMYDFFINECESEANEMSLNSRESVQAEFHGFSYELSSDNVGIIKSEIRIMNTSFWYLGYYQAIFNENGEMQDDFLAFE